MKTAKGLAVGRPFSDGGNQPATTSRLDARVGFVENGGWIQVDQHTVTGKSGPARAYSQNITWLLLLDGHSRLGRKAFTVIERIIR